MLLRASRVSVWAVSLLFSAAVFAGDHREVAAKLRRSRGDVPSFAVSAASVVGSPAIEGLGAQGTIIDSVPGFGVARSLPLSVSTARDYAQQSELAAAAGLKIYVSTPGWQRVTRSMMAAAGYDPGPVSRTLAVFSGGVEQAISVEDGGDGRFDAGDAVEFYGQPLDALSTGARTYWLTSVKGTGSRIKATKGKAAGQVGASVPFTYERSDNTYYLTSIITNGEAKNFYGPAIYSDAPSSIPLRVEQGALSSTTPASIKVTVRGATPDHRTINVGLNGSPIGEIPLPGEVEETFTFAVPHSMLQQGTNDVTLQSTGPWWDASVGVRAALTYQHLLRADAGVLEVSLPGSRKATIGGFPAGGKIRVLDVTDPSKAADLEITTAAEPGGTVAASFTTTGSGDRVIFAFHSSRMVTSAELAANRPSSIASGVAPAFAIVTHTAFAPAAESLAALRRQEGITTAVLDVTDLYDEFTFGVRGPEAIRSYLRMAALSRNGAPKYLLLLGDSSFDPRQYLGAGSFDFVPTKLVATQFMKTASDDWYLDLDDNGTPDVAAGRLPVRTPEEASTIIGRIVARSTPSGDWSQRALFVADAPVGYDFMGMVAGAAAQFPGSLSQSTVDAGATANPAGDTIAALNQGHLVVTFFGHASIANWGWWPFFHSSNARDLTNGSKLPFVVAMNCLNGYFHDLYMESLAEAFLRAENGGAIAVWASSTLTFPPDQIRMNEELNRQLFSADAPRIGEACRRAKLVISDVDVKNSWILFGDPTMKLR